MEPSSTMPIVIGLVDSLDNTLRVVQQHASQLAKEYQDENITRLEAALNSSCCKLVDTRNSLDTKRIHSQIDGLLDTLESIGSNLGHLKDSAHNAQKARPEILIRQRMRPLLDQGIDVILSSIVIAKNIIDNIRMCTRLVASRPDRTSHQHIAETDVRYDIRHFVDRVIKEDAAIDHMLSGHPDFRSELIETLTTCSNGM